MTTKKKKKASKRSASWYRRYSLTPKGRYRRLKYNAKKYKKAVLLCFEEYELLLEMPCHYCGITLEEWGGMGYWLDRLDSSIGYELSNVVPCCWRCNRIKGDDIPIELMKRLGRQIKKWRKEVNGKTKRAKKVGSVSKRRVQRGVSRRSNKRGDK